MFTTGFTMNASEHAESMEGDTLLWMKGIAAEKNSVVCGSIIVVERKKFYNRLLWVQPDGQVHFYDKRHLFRMAGEHKTFSGGNKKLIVEWKGWRICPMVCYDLRFPVWSRNVNDYDLLLYVANWPQRRKYAWNQLLIARAIENQCYVAGVNRVGLDGQNITYSGDSVVLDPLGQKRSSLKTLATAIETVTLNGKTLSELRKEFPVLMDADQFKIT
jgi:predicted amidohydrolase